MKNILLLEDNESIIMGLKYSLEQEGFDVETAKSVLVAKNKINKKEYSIYLLDITLPDGNGFEICKLIKEKYDKPVIFLTARDEETNVVYGLDMGADDYVTKPFRIRELISRINRIISRYEKNQRKSNILKYQDIEINIDKCKVTKNNKEIIFTSLEYKILLLLFGNVGNLITRDQLLDKIWDIAGNFVNDNTLTVYIKRIREKLDDKDGKIIQTIRGIGYRVGN